MTPCYVLSQPCCWHYLHGSGSARCRGLGPRNRGFRLEIERIAPRETAITDEDQIVIREELSRRLDRIFVT
jgi:hypothetical protein